MTAQDSKYTKKHWRAHYKMVNVLWILFNITLIWKVREYKRKTLNLHYTLKQLEVIKGHFWWKNKTMKETDSICPGKEEQNKSEIAIVSLLILVYKFVCTNKWT